MAPLSLRIDPDPLRDSYRTGDPFPHAVLDGLFDDSDLDRVLAEFSALSS